MPCQQIKSIPSTWNGLSKKLDCNPVQIFRCRPNNSFQFINTPFEMFDLIYSTLEDMSTLLLFRNLICFVISHGDKSAGGSYFDETFLIWVPWESHKAFKNLFPDGFQGNSNNGLIVQVIAPVGEWKLGILIICSIFPLVLLFSVHWYARLMPSLWTAMYSIFKVTLLFHNRLQSPTHQIWHGTRYVSACKIYL